METAKINTKTSGKPTIIETNTTYTSTHLESTKTLDIDARGDRIYIHIEELRESGKSFNVTMLIPRTIWDKYRKLLNKFDGSII